MARELRMGIKAKKALEAGVNKVADTAKITLGPKGRNVLIDRSANHLPPLIINDGVSIVREIVLDEQFENMGAALVIEAATKTNDMVGDGTTTAIVLTQHMINEGLKNVVAGANPIFIRKGMQKAAEAVNNELNAIAVSITTKEDIQKVAEVSSKSSEIGELIAKAMEALHKEQAFITIEDSKTMNTELDIIDGMRLTTGYLSKIMCTDAARKTVEFMMPYILLVNKEIQEIEELLPLLEKVVKEKAPLLIIAKDITGNALNALVLNKAKGIIQVAGIKAPGFGRMQTDFLEDIAVFTGGVIVDETKGLYLKDIDTSMLGKAESVQVQQENTILTGGMGRKEEIEKRVDWIRKQSDESTSSFDKERYRERISKLTGAIAVIRVGAESEVEASEYKLRIEDAISSTKVALQGGIVPGGGAAYLYAQRSIDEMIEKTVLDEDEITGASIVKKALEKPMKQIIENAGLSGEVLIAKQKSMKYPIGFNAETEQFQNLIQDGVVDPLETKIRALQCAVSAASTLLTSEAVNIIVKNTEVMPTG